MKKKLLGLFISVLLLTIVFSGCFDNSNLTNRAPPMITFKQNLISGRLIVTSVDREDVGWWDFDVWVDGELCNYNHDYVKENDSVYAGVRGKLVNIIWKPTNTSIGTWSFADKYNYSTIEVANYTVTTSWFNESEKQYLYMPGFYHSYPDDATDIHYIINITAKNVGNASVNWVFFTYKFYNASNEYLFYGESQEDTTYLAPWDPLESENFSYSTFKSILDNDAKNFENAEKVDITIEAIYIDYWATD